ncbi:phosphatase PAP2 family protein [Pendulispora albinea]|uniref:Phosphatase PAP2 family protein n=1 Tax=Pendulispora albinea TaxID=2741071 RepID=A0ABZ2LVL8_9BACT
MRRLGWLEFEAGLLSLVLVASMVLPSPAHADEVQKPPASLTWNSSWPTFRPVEYVVTGVAGAAAAALFLFARSPSQPHWTGGILFDDAARDTFRLRNPGARDAARKASDVTALTAMVLVYGVDSLLIPLVRKSDRVALQLTLMNLEALALSSLTTNSLFIGVGRARPSYEDCQRDFNFDPLCNSGATSSFPSGHANGAFTAAGLSCAHHGHLPLYGGGAADVAACIGTLGLATATASLRVLGDRHYVTDVLTSAGIGFGFGYGVPTLLHYVAGSGGEQSGDQAKFSLIPMGGASQYGLMAVGSF